MLVLSKKFIVWLVMLPLSLALFVWLNRDNLPVALTQYGILIVGIILLLRFKPVLPLIAGVFLFLYATAPYILRGETDVYNIGTSLGLSAVVGLTLWLYRAKGLIALVIPTGILLISIVIAAFFVFQNVLK